MSEKPVPAPEKRTFWFTAARALTWLLGHTVFPLRYYGRAYADLDAPFILVSNHKHWLDPLAAGKVIRCPVCGPVDRSEVRFASGKSKTQKKTVVPRGKGAPPAELYRSFADFGNEVVEQEEMVGWGFTPEQAEILHEFMCGMGTVGIAGRHRKSLSEVLDIVSPYISVLRGRFPQ